MRLGDAIPGGRILHIGAKQQIITNDRINYVKNFAPNPIFMIPGNVPSKKNSKGVMKHKSTGEPVLILSKLYQKYETATKAKYEKEGMYFRLYTLLHNITLPYRIEFFFVRNSKRLFDYAGPLETVQDLMVKYGWIDDDNSDIILPSFRPYQRDPNHPCVEIKLLHR